MNDFISLLPSPRLSFELTNPSDPSPRTSFDSGPGFEGSQSTTVQPVKAAKRSRISSSTASGSARVRATSWRSKAR